MAGVIGGYVIQLSEVGELLPVIAEARQTQCTHRDHVEWTSRQRRPGGGGRGVAELSQSLHREPAPALAQPLSRKFSVNVS